MIRDTESAAKSWARETRAYVARASLANTCAAQDLAARFGRLSSDRRDVGSPCRVSVVPSPIHPPSIDWYGLTRETRGDRQRARKVRGGRQTYENVPRTTRRAIARGESLS